MGKFIYQNQRSLSKIPFYLSFCSVKIPLSITGSLQDERRLKYGKGSLLFDMHNTPSERIDKTPICVVHHVAHLVLYDFIDPLL